MRTPLFTSNLEKYTLFFPVGVFNYLYLVLVLNNVYSDGSHLVNFLEFLPVPETTNSAGRSAGF